MTPPRVLPPERNLVPARCLAGILPILDHFKPRSDGGQMQIWAKDNKRGGLLLTYLEYERVTFCSLLWRWSPLDFSLGWLLYPSPSNLLKTEIKFARIGTALRAKVTPLLVYPSGVLFSSYGALVTLSSLVNNQLLLKRCFSFFLFSFCFVFVFYFFVCLLQANQ